MRNSQIVIDMDKAVKKWKPIVEKLGITNPEKLNSMCEYAEMHASAIQSGMVKENVMYANGANTAGMGAVAFPGLTGVAGTQGTLGSGDLGQTLLPASLKIAAMTIGLELVPTINVNSNRVDFLYWDWTYDDVASLGVNDERASTFKIDISGVAGLEAFIRGAMATFGVTEGRGTISAPIYFDITGTNPQTLTPPSPTAVTNWLQFKGFSRIDGKPMFRAYIQKNTASAGAWTFAAGLNTFPATGSILTAMQVADFLNSTISSVGVALNPQLVSLNEDFIDDFTTNRQSTPLTRSQWDTDEAGKIGPSSKTASIEIGVAHVSAALRLSEIGDWKRMYGVDVVEKTKAQLINQISQKISMEIVTNVKRLALANRATAPVAPAGLAAGLVLGGITDGRIFDYSVSATAGTLGGENNLSIANKLWGKVLQSSYYVATDGRIGGIDFIVTSGTVAGILKNVARYTLNPLDAKLAGPNQLMPAGTIDGIKIYVDPYMSPADLTIYGGRKGTNDTPGLKFFAYMLAENVEVVSERTMAPHLYMYSRYAVGEFGFFPQKQYMAIKIEDVNGILY